jgi:hypothetical protein
VTWVVVLVDRSVESGAQQIWVVTHISDWYHLVVDVLHLLISVLRIESLSRSNRLWLFSVSHIICISRPAHIPLKLIALLLLCQPLDMVSYLLAFIHGGIHLRQKRISDVLLPRWRLWCHEHASLR